MPTTPSTSWSPQPSIPRPVSAPASSTSPGPKNLTPRTSPTAGPPLSPSSGHSPAPWPSSAPPIRKIALKRLAELAANTTDSTVTDAVGDALLSLWDQHDLRPTIRATLASWFDASQRHYTDAARRAFLHLAGRTAPDGIPVLLAEGGPQPTPWALSGWRCAMDGELTRDTQDAVNTWLDAALLDSGLQLTVLQTLTETVHRSAEDRTYLVPRYLLLNHAAYGWEPTRPGQQPTARTHLRDALVTALREADPTAPARLHHAPPPA